MKKNAPTNSFCPCNIEKTSLADGQFHHNLQNLTESPTLETSSLMMTDYEFHLKTQLSLVAGVKDLL